MLFLSVHEIKKLACRKGYSCEKTGTLKGGISLVTITDPKGRPVEGAKYASGHSLDAARRLLEALPDRLKRLGKPVEKDRPGYRLARNLISTSASLPRP